MFANCESQFQDLNKINDLFDEICWQYCFVKYLALYVVMHRIILLEFRKIHPNDSIRIAFVQVLYHAAWSMLI